MWLAPSAFTWLQKRLAEKCSTSVKVTSRISGSTIICAPPM